jgi:hypothetical protein
MRLTKHHGLGNDFLVLLDLGARLGELPGDVEAVDQRLHVERRPADQQAAAAPSLQVGQDGLGLALEPGDRAVLPRVEHVDQVVGHLGLLGRGRLGRPEVHPPVHLHRVGGDQLPGRVAAGQRQRQRRLARGRGPHQHGVAPRSAHEASRSFAKHRDSASSREWPYGAIGLHPPCSYRAMASGCGRALSRRRGP